MSHPTRVTYIIATLGAGGAERQLGLLLEHVDRGDVEPRVVAYVDGRWRSKFEALDVPVEVVPYWRGKMVALLGTVRAIRRHRPDIVHTVGDSANYVGRLAAVLDRVPVVIVSERSDPEARKSSLQLRVDRILGRFTDQVIANSEHAARFYVARGILRSGQVTVVRNGIAALSSAEHRAPRAADADIVTIGNFRPEKINADLMTAMRQLLDRRAGVTLHIAGEGPGRKAIEQAARELGIEEHVRFHGHVEDVKSLLDTADVYVHTSQYEGMPNAVMEAMAAGVPCVVFDAPWAAELVGDDGRGIVVPMGDTRRLADAVDSLLADPEAAGRVARQARTFVEQQLSVDKMVESTVDLYRILLGRERRRRRSSR